MNANRKNTICIYMYDNSDNAACKDIELLYEIYCVFFLFYHNMSLQKHTGTVLNCIQSRLLKI